MNLSHVHDAESSENTEKSFYRPDPKDERTL